MLASVAHRIRSARARRLRQCRPGPPGRCCRAAVCTCPSRRASHSTPRPRPRPRLHRTALRFWASRWAGRPAVPFVRASRAPARRSKARLPRRTEAGPSAHEDRAHLNPTPRAARVDLCRHPTPPRSLHKHPQPNYGVARAAGRHPAGVACGTRTSGCLGGLQDTAQEELAQALLSRNKHASIFFAYRSHKPRQATTKQHEHRRSSRREQ
jgi:hypothetical protein